MFLTMRNTDPATAVALVRVSTDEQKNGPDAQRAEITRFAAQNGLVIREWFEEHVSGAAEIEDRPGLLAALAAMRAHGCGVLLVQKRDRLARDPMVATLVEREVCKLRGRIVAADGMGNGSTPGDELVRGILDVVGRFERRIIAARTSAGMQAMKRRGERVGAVPFGYQLAPDGVHLVPHAGEQATVTRVAELRAAGESLRGIVITLETEGHTARTGRALGKTQVERIVAALKSLDAAG